MRERTGCRVMTTPDVRLQTRRPSDLSRLAWPGAFVAVAAMTFGYLHTREAPRSASEIQIVHPTPTVLKDLRELGRLETLALHVEKVVDVKDRQTRLYGLVDAEDSVLFVANGEIALGVDLAKLREGDARFDTTTRTAYVHLPAPEVLYASLRRATLVRPRAHDRSSREAQRGARVRRAARRDRGFRGRREGSEGDRAGQRAGRSPAPRSCQGLGRARARRHLEWRHHARRHALMKG